MSDQLLTILASMLIDRPKERFNIFKVMRHGTHEKQLSNVFAWLLDSDGTHRLGVSFQQMFVAEVNLELLRLGRDPIGDDTYGVRQEKNTAPDGQPEDIADIVLDGAQTTLVVENYGTSDGHGHSYDGYKAFGELSGTRSIVVMLCETEARTALTDGWQNAPVVLYSRLLDRLLEHIDDAAYRKANAEQTYFIENMHRHFSDRTALIMESQSLIGFIEALCRGTEAEKFGRNNQEQVARELGDRLRDEAIQRFGESRELLAKVKLNLRGYCDATLRAQVNEAMGRNVLGELKVNWSGMFQWCVTFKNHEDNQPHIPRSNLIHLAFGPTIWQELNEGRWKEATLEPDYARLLVLHDAGGTHLTQSALTLAEILEGPSPDDFRLRDEIVQLLGSAPAELGEV